MGTASVAAVPLLRATNARYTSWLERTTTGIGRVARASTTAPASAVL
jgi:hypothetical protein